MKNSIFYQDTRDRIRARPSVGTARRTRRGRTSRSTDACSACHARTPTDKAWRTLPNGMVRRRRAGRDALRRPAAASECNVAWSIESILCWYTGHIARRRCARIDDRRIVYARIGEHTLSEGDHRCKLHSCSRTRGHKRAAGRMAACI